MHTCRCNVHTCRRGWLGGSPATFLGGLGLAALDCYKGATHPRHCNVLDHQEGTFLPCPCPRRVAFCSLCGQVQVPLVRPPPPSDHTRPFRSGVEINPHVGRRGAALGLKLIGLPGVTQRSHPFVICAARSHLRGMGGPWAWQMLCWAACVRCAQGGAAMQVSACTYEQLLLPGP